MPETIDPETCEHENRDLIDTDVLGLPEMLWAEYRCEDCGTRISVEFEPTGDTIERRLDGTVVEKEADDE